MESLREFIAAEQANINPTLRQKAVVLDAFSGIGSAILCLKRLGIAMKTVITVEYDPIARFVFEHHHNQQKDAIQYHSFNRFEELESSIDQVLKEHGPIDIIIGGPPCVDFSHVNANRSGILGKQGNYTVRFGKLISYIRMHPLQNGIKCFVVAENVPISEDDGLSVVEEAFEASPICIDAKYFSPCKRLRMYFTTIRLDSIAWDSPQADTGAIYDDGWEHPACAVSDWIDGLVGKANTFMASKSRLDDDRMLKVRPRTDGPGFLKSYITANEREVMMGFPRNYVKAPLNKLYDALTKAFMALDWTSDDDLIKEFEWLHTFSGLKDMYSFGQYTKGPPWFELKLHVPETNYYLNKEEYAKRLVGNSFSIPVVEHLLRPLQNIFASQEYNDVDYTWPWGYLEAGYACE